MNSKILFYFKFSSKDGMDSMLENGPWLIRNAPLILKKGSPNANVLKEDVCNVLFRVKIHDVPITMFIEEGLSVIATKLGISLLLDIKTSIKCTESWGRSSYARAMIELRVDVELKETLMDVHDETTRFMASSSNRAGGGVNDASLLEDEDYDTYDGYENDDFELTKEELAFCDVFDITLRG
ncbi:putative reverse transcriptase domain-containing protein [Tanacetum coccineum]